MVIQSFVFAIDLLTNDFFYDGPFLFGGFGCRQATKQKGPGYTQYSAPDAAKWFGFLLRVGIGIAGYLLLSLPLRRSIHPHSEHQENVSIILKL